LTWTETSPLARRRPGILVVDDEETLRDLLNWALQRQGFVVWLAADGRDALHLYEAERMAIDLVLLDMNMPGLDGLQTIRALQQINPAMRWCFMSGGVDCEDVAGLSQGGALRFFAKPFNPSEVAQILWGLVGGSAGA
jgi:two-component system, cell cycle sensor histidine kinase and response regulator CckA